MRRLDDEFDAFVLSSSRGLFRLAHRLTGDWYAAEDLVQTTLWRVARNWDRARDAPLPYARRILVNLTVDRVRSRTRRPSEVGGDRFLDRADPTPASQVEEREVLLAALRGLRPRQRAVLVLRYWEDLSVEQTAEALGCTTGTVKSTSSKGLANLRALLENQGARP